MARNNRITSENQIYNSSFAFSLTIIIVDKKYIQIKNPNVFEDFLQSFCYTKLYNFAIWYENLCEKIALI